jgi:hypothetical protein
MGLCSHDQYEEAAVILNKSSGLSTTETDIHKYFNTHGAKHYNLE